MADRHDLVSLSKRETKVYRFPTGCLKIFLIISKGTSYLQNICVQVDLIISIEMFRNCIFCEIFMIEFRIELETTGSTKKLVKIKFANLGVKTSSHCDLGSFAKKLCRSSQDEQGYEVIRIFSHRKVSVSIRHEHKTLKNPAKRNRSLLHQSSSCSCRLITNI